MSIETDKCGRRFREAGAAAADNRNEIGKSGGFVGLFARSKRLFAKKSGTGDKILKKYLTKRPRCGIIVKRSANKAE